MSDEELAAVKKLVEDAGFAHLSRDRDRGESLDLEAAQYLPDLIRDNDRLRARVADLEAALKPFAEWAVGWNENWPDSLAVNETKTDDSPTLGDCRRAPVCEPLRV